MKAADWSVRIPIDEAATLMECSVSTLQCAIRRSKNPLPIGFYCKEEGAQRGSYVIIRKRLLAYMEAIDMKPADVPPFINERA